MHVAAFGDINIDVAVAVDEAPAPGEETFATGGRVGLGGSAANTAIVLAALGVPTTLIAQVGRDPFGDYAVGQLGSSGVRTGHIAVSPTETTGFILVTVTGSGERAMIGLRGANAAFGEGTSWMDEVDWLHLSAYALLTDPQRAAARAALAAARQRGLPISVDIPSGVGKALGPALFADLAGAQIVACGMPAMVAVAGPDEPVERIRSHGVARVAVTAGSGTCRLVTGAEDVHLTPPHVPVVDTTGAGDSFVAGLVAASVAGLGAGATLVTATALGAAAVTHPGAGTSLAAVDPARDLVAGGRWTDADPTWREDALSYLAGRS